MAHCNNICLKYKAEYAGLGSRYAAGQKRCSYCEIYIVFDGTHCPCCNTCLRYRTHHSKSKVVAAIKRFDAAVIEGVESAGQKINAFDAAVESALSNPKCNVCGSTNSSIAPKDWLRKDGLTYCRRCFMRQLAASGTKLWAGRTHKPETLKLMSEQRRGKNNAFYRKQHSDFTRAVMSAIKQAKNEVILNEVGAKRRFSVEHRENIRRRIIEINLKKKVQQLDTGIAACVLASDYGQEPEQELTILAV